MRNSIFVSVAVMLHLACVATAADQAARTGGGRNAQYVAPDELKTRAVWVEQNFLDRPANGKAPFSFTYDGQPAAGRLQDWKKKSTLLDRNRMEHLLTWTDSRTGLAVQCRAVEYSDYPTVEWALSFENTGKAATPIIENIRALAVKFERAQSEEFVLHCQNGDDCSPQSYGVHEAQLEAGARRDFAPDGGRPTDGAYPYFNIEYDGGGVIAVVGWPGQWAAWFERDQANGLKISAGQQLTRFKLLPGEKARSPLVVLQFWTGDWVRSQNVWRRWMIAHNMPRPGGQLPQPFTSTLMGLNQSAKGEIGFIDAFVKGGIHFDYWWMSAGWYPMSKDWWEVGTWEPDPVRFPNGIWEVSDHAHANKMKVVLWFEPERVHPGSWLYTNHPEWLLSKGDEDKEINNPWLNARGGDVDKLLNLGDPAARQWLIDHIDNLLTKQGVDLYQQDFNFKPLDYWRNTDPPDRQGITENQYVQGYLAYWDELRRRRPGMLIDSCASGGRRNDLETLRRGVVMLRSDFNQPNDPSKANLDVGNQGQTYGLSFWVPFHGTAVSYDDVYAVRSHLTPILSLLCDPMKADLALFKRRLDDWKTVADDFLGDYYPLTPYSLSEDTWIAWQFNRPDAGQGMVQAFRRSHNGESLKQFKLRGLDAAAIYELRNLDLDEKHKMTGRALMEEGLPIKLAAQRQAAIIVYHRFDAAAPPAPSGAATLHVAPSGNDAWSGTLAKPSVDKTDGPKATLAAASAVAHHGDTVLIHAGTYREPLRPARSGTADKPITYKAAGDGPVTVTAADPVTEWIQHDGSIYKAPLPPQWNLGAWKNAVFVDNKIMIEARYPNPTTAWHYAGSPGYNTLQANVDSAVVSKNGTNGFDFKTGRPDNYWNGCRLWTIGDASYHAQATTVSSSTPATVTLADPIRDKLWSPLKWPPDGPQFGRAFLTGKLEELDSPGEWHIGGGWIYLKMPPGIASLAGHAVSVNRGRDVIAVNNLNHIVIEGITFIAGQFHMNGGNNTLRHCTFYGMTAGFDDNGPYCGLGGSNNLADSCLFDEFGGGVLYIGGGTGTTIRNCVFSNIDSSGKYCVAALRDWAARAIEKDWRYLVARCTFKRAGSSQVSVRADIRYCDFSDASMLSTDTGNIYVGHCQGKGTTIHHNWFKQTQYRPFNTSGCQTYALYLDDGCHDFIIHHNVVLGGLAPFHLGNNGEQTTGLQICNNVFWGHDDPDRGADMYTRNQPMSGIKVYNNTLGSKGSDPAGLWGPPGVDWKNNYEKKADPGFVDAGKFNFQLRADAVECRDRGIVIPGITDNVKDGKPDIGAYEHGLPNGGWEFYPPGASGKTGAPEGR